MRDAARSVKQNIQEGYTRNSLGEYIHFLEIAKASLAELRGDVDDSFDDGLFDAPSFENIKGLSTRTYYLLFRLIQALRNKQGRSSRFPNRRAAVRK